MSTRRKNKGSISIIWQKMATRAWRWTIYFRRFKAITEAIGRELRVELKPKKKKQDEAASHLAEATLFLITI